MENYGGVIRVHRAFCSIGWEVAGDHIRSGAGSSDNDYLILSLHVPGFK